MSKEPVRGHYAIIDFNGWKYFEVPEPSGFFEFLNTQSTRLLT